MSKITECFSNCFWIGNSFILFSKRTEIWTYIQFSEYFFFYILPSFSNTFNYFFLAYPLIGMALTFLFVKYFVKEDINHGVTKILYSISRKKGRLKTHHMWSSMAAACSASSTSAASSPSSSGPDKRRMDTSRCTKAQLQMA